MISSPGSTTSPMAISLFRGSMPTRLRTSVVAGVRAAHRQADEDVLRRAPQDFASSTTSSAGPPVQLATTFCVAVGDPRKRPGSGDAALREAGGDLHLAGRAPPRTGRRSDDFVGHLHRPRARAGQPADQIAAVHLRRHVGDQAGARPACRGSACTTAKWLPAPPAAAAFGPRTREVLRLERRDHRRQRGLLLVLDAGREHADAYGADPVRRPRSARAARRRCVRPAAPARR